MNHSAAEGMSASVRTAVSAAFPLSQGIIFALGDQPFIRPEIYKTLIQSYRQNLGLLTYPLYRGQKGNPQLYDRKTWPLLLKLRGDRGGRVITPMLPEHECIGVETPFSAVATDVDTPEDYIKYL